jgi:hypothetical protein
VKQVALSITTAHPLTANSRQLRAFSACQDQSRIEACDCGVGASVRLALAS